jgi:hypothetical protein
MVKIGANLWEAVWPGDRWGHQGRFRGMLEREKPEHRHGTPVALQATAHNTMPKGSLLLSSLNWLRN